jgi:hypothetical protein
LPVEKEIYMTRLAKALALILILVFLLACNFVTQPLQDAQNLAATAQSVTTLIPMETIQALPSVIPQETLEAFPSAMPTLEALGTQFGNYFDPQGTPLQEWRGVPILPQATAGQEFSDSNTYSFKANASVKEIQEYYKSEMASRGWTQPFDFPLEDTGGLIVFDKDDTTLTITITSAEGSVLVLLMLA